MEIALEQAIATGKSNATPETVERNDVCDFGQWLASKGHGAFGSEKDYREVFDLHTTFHREAAKVLRLALGGRDGKRGCSYPTGTREGYQWLERWQRLSRQSARLFSPIPQGNVE